MRAAIACLLVSMLVGCAPPVVPNSPEACHVEKVTSIPLRRHGSFWAVDVLLDGQPAALMLDTGANTGALTAAAAARLRTRIGTGRFTVTSGAGDTIYLRSFEIDRMEIGGQTVERLTVPELPETNPLGDGYDGIIGMSAFERYDVAVDLPGSTLELYRRRYCPGGGPPWPRAATFRRTGPALSRDTRPMVRARINGREARALLDTGATITIVDAGFARAAGAPPPDPTPDPARTGRLRTVSDANVPMWRSRFDSLEIVGARLDKPELWVTGLGMTSDMIVGQDVLRHLRIWISNGSDAVYIAPAAGAPARP
jgi:predicted aspartyl protease